MSLKTNSFQFGDYLLDPQEKVLFRDAKPVPVTPKAFLLLQTLVERRGRLVEKEQLMEAVWADSFVEQGNLSFTINLLRRCSETIRTTLVLSRPFRGVDIDSSRKLRKFPAGTVQMGIWSIHPQIDSAQIHQDRS